MASPSTTSTPSLLSPARNGWALYVNRLWISSKAHLNLFCHIHFNPRYDLRTDHQFWCLTAQYPFSRVYIGTWALWIHLLYCCSKLEKFHKTLSESDSWFMEQRSCFVVPCDQVKISKLQEIMLQQNHLISKVFLFRSFLYEWANRCRRGYNVEGSCGIAITLFVSLYRKQLREMEKQLLITYNEVK